MKEEEKQQIRELYHKQADVMADAFIQSSERIQKEFPEGTQEDYDNMMKQIISNAQNAVNASLESMKEALASETGKLIKEKKNG